MSSTIFLFIMTTPKLFITDGESARNHRRKLGINQQQFWSKLGVTQSGGSRYESGRDIPLPVLMLLHIAYAPEKQAANLVDYLRNVESDKPGKI